VDETKDDVPGGDIMRGVPRITAFLRVLLDEPKLHESQVYHWISKGHIPAGSIGSVKVASKTVLRKALRGDA
jgi:hypothetical protein